MVSKTIQKHKDETIAVVLDSIRQQRQTLVFCSSKRGAEAQAENIAKAHKRTTEPHEQLAEQALNVLANPTKQCKRLAYCLKHGIAFHHAGLASKQRDLIEDAFRAGSLHTICSTPTLAAGLDLPAFRTIIRDVKRFGQRGMVNIPVLEYLQMAGRAGRPGKETHGEAILIAKSEDEVEELTRIYLRGEVEDIFSKLAVEPVLRTYVLSLIAAELIKSHGELYAFFDSTFYAHQFGDTTKLHNTLDRMVRLLREWKMLEGEVETPMFQSAADLAAKQEQTLQATLLGQRVSELYLDPQTAHQIIEQLPALEKSQEPEITILHTLCCTLEMRPLIRTRRKDLDAIQAFLEEHEPALDEYDFYQVSQDNYEDSIRTTQFFLAWIDEWEEQSILDAFNVRPGEITGKNQRAIWLLHASEELARLCKQHGLRKHFSRLQTRVKHGVKAELMPLLQFRNIGRVRARKLYGAGVVDAGQVKQATPEQLAGLVGPKLAQDLKQQVGQTIELPDKPEENIVSGQAQLGDF